MVAAVTVFLAAVLRNGTHEAAIASSRTRHTKSNAVAITHVIKRDKTFTAIFYVKGQQLGHNYGRIKTGGRAGARREEEAAHYLNVRSCFCVERGRGRVQRDFNPW